MTRSRNYVAALFTMNVGLLFAAEAHAGSWQANAPFGADLKGDLYTPTTPAASPAILVVIHMCTGHASTVRGWFDSAADKNGFYLIAPDAGKQCFDSSATRSGDRAAIVKMVDYLVTNKNADKSRVFAAGMSSGGCMTNTLLAIYPDVFVGGSAMPGFPAGGWPAGDITCTKCGSSPPSTDGKYWGDIARKAFTWNGTYPCSQQWVGGSDEYNFNGWLPAAAAQFQNLSSLGNGMPGTAPSNGWTRTIYKDASGNVRLETNLGPSGASGQKHDLENVGPTFMYASVVSFLGLDKSTGSCGVASAGGGSGGTSSVGGSGGAPAGGKANSGGTNGGGGSTSSGGSLSQGGGATSSTGTGGGTNGGALASTGGATSNTGGVAVSTGGLPASTGGLTNSAGGATSSSGGSFSPGGNTSSAGTSTPTGTAGSTTAASGGGSDSSGCSIGVSGAAIDPHFGALAGLVAAIAGMVARRRRQTAA